MKKISIILCALVLCGLVSITLVACDTAKSGYANVNTEASLNNVLGGKKTKIRLTDNIVLSDSIYVNKSCTIDLNGHKIVLSSQDNKSNVRVDGDNTEVIIKNGTIERKESETATAVWTNKNNTLSLDKVNVLASGYGLMAARGANVKLLNDSVVKAKWHAVTTNNNFSGEGNAFTIENSKLESTEDAAIYLANYTTLNVTGSQIKGLSAMHLMMGDVNITGSTLEATSATHNPYDEGNFLLSNGTKGDEGSLIVIRANHYYDSIVKTNKLKLNLSDNTYTSLSGVDATLYNLNSDLSSKENVEDSYSYAKNYFAELQGTDFVIKSYVYEDGKVNEYVSDQTNEYVVTNSEDTLRELIAQGKNVRLSGDINLSNVLQIEKSCVIDLNGHSLTLDALNDNLKARKAVIRVYGENSAIAPIVVIKNGDIIKQNSGNAVAVAVASVYNNELTLDHVNVVSDSQGLVPSWGSKINILDSHVQAKWQALGTNNSQSGIDNAINVENSQLISTDDVSVFVSNYTKVNISDTKIQGLTAMHLLLGDITVENCDIVATSSYHPYTSSDINSSGTKENEGSAIVIRANHYYDSSYKSNELKLNLNDNTITTQSNVDVSIYNCNNAKNWIPSSSTTGVTVTDSNEYAVNYFKDSGLTIKTYNYSNGNLESTSTESEGQVA